MASLDEYAAFVAILEQGSLTAAARQLGRSLQSVSRALAKLEREVGVPLVVRTTRSLRPTEAGRQFHTRIAAALDSIEQARDSLVHQGAPLSGRIRVGASTQFGPVYLVPVLTAFMERHPEVEVELFLEDQPVNLIDQGLDLSLRIGHLPDSSLRALKLGEVRRIVFAAPAYLQAHGRPERPEDLPAHECVLRRSTGREVWRFGDGPDAIPVEVHGRFRTDNPPARNEAVAAGFGLGLAPLYQIARMLESGRVERVLSGIESSPFPVHFVWPETTTMANRTRALIDFVASTLSLKGL